VYEILPSFPLIDRFWTRNNALSVLSGKKHCYHRLGVCLQAPGFIDLKRGSLLFVLVQTPSQDANTVRDGR
jgi:hypothetical protein